MQNLLPDGSSGALLGLGMLAQQRTGGDAGFWFHRMQVALSVMKTAIPLVFADVWRLVNGRAAGRAEMARNYRAQAMYGGRCSLPSKAYGRKMSPRYIERG